MARLLFLAILLVALLATSVTPALLLMEMTSGSVKTMEHGVVPTHVADVSKHSIVYFKNSIG